MASSSRASSGSATIEEAMDLRKRKRMQSNRESARRSRQRKQKHLDELRAQVSHLTKENGQIATALNVATQLYLGVEAENCVMRAQMMELGNRLESLNEILSIVNEAAGDGMRPWSFGGMNNQQPIIASVDMYQY